MATDREIQDAVEMLQAELTANGPAIAKVLEDFRAELRLYMSSNNGEVYCQRHATPSDIHRWSKMTWVEASEWIAFLRDEMDESEPCEACRSEASR